MKAVVYDEYGGPEVLTLQEVKKPVPKGNEVLIRVRAVSVNYGDIMARNFKNVSISEFNMPLLFWLIARMNFGVNTPKRKVLGNVFAGEIESAGHAVTRFKKGEAVFGYTGQSMGTYAEYLCMAETDILAAKPSNMTFEEASTIPYGAIMALSLLKKANIQKGQKVLINGASGGIGSVAVQLAKYYFEAEVTGVCSTAQIGYVRDLGADRVIDYKKEDFSKNGESYNLIFDILGKGSFSRFKTSLQPKGIYLLASFKSGKLLQMAYTSIFGEKKVVCAIAMPTSEDLLFIKDLIEKEKIRAFIAECFPLEEAAEGHRYVEAGKKKGDVVIMV